MCVGVPAMPARSGKGLPMWVFDGEEWANEGAAEKKREVEVPVRIERFVPELQVIEVVPVTKSNPIPPFPLP